MNTTIKMTSSRNYLFLSFFIKAIMTYLLESGPKVSQLYLESLHFKVGCGVLS